MRTQVQSLASLSGLTIWHCRELWCRSQMGLGSHIAVAAHNTWQPLRAHAVLALYDAPGPTACLLPSVLITPSWWTLGEQKWDYAK